MTVRLSDKDVIATFRVLLATCVQQYGVLDRLVLTREQLEAAGTGALKVEDKKDGSIVLKVTRNRKLIV